MWRGSHYRGALTIIGLDEVNWLSAALEGLGQAWAEERKDRPRQWIKRTRRADIVPRITDLTKAQKAYLAGIIDGEGSVSIIHERPHSPGDRERFRLAVTVGSTSHALFEWLAHCLRAPYWRRPENPKAHRPSWLIALHGNVAALLLLAVQPYIIIKRPHIQLALQFQRLVNTSGYSDERTAQLQKYWMQMKSLNMKGPGHTGQIREVIT